MFAFSTCWNTDRHTDGRAMLNEVRELGFEHAELGHGTRLSLYEGIQQAVAAGEIKISSVHNFCPLPLGVMGPAPDYYLPSSVNERERELAVRHTLRTIECAASLGARAVVMHLGIVPIRNYTARLLTLYAEGQAETREFQRVREKALTTRAKKRQKFLDRVFRTLEAVTPRASALGITLCMETRFGIEEIPNEQDAQEILDRFGPDVVAYWHDVGHAQVRENLGLLSQEKLLELFRGRTAGMHLQDFAPPASDHLPPGFGTIDFGRLARFVTDEMLLTWEIHPRWKPEQLVDSFKKVHELLRPTVNA